MKPRRTYQDTVFRMLFSERENVIELFNALEGTDYGPETEVEFATLEDALYADLKNDLGFIIDNRFLILTEQQSTINENMCLRQLEYIGRTYEKLVPALKLYGKRNVKIPTPEFFVVYTGSEKWNASRLRLSDSFLNQAPENSLELVVKVIKMKYNMGSDETSEILERSEKLHGYSTLLGYVRQYRSEGFDLKEAINLSILRCTKEGVLREFLERNSPEVGSMLYKEITSEEFAEIRADEAAREAAKEYYEKGIANLIATYKEFGLPKDEALNKLREKYPMDEAKAMVFLEDY